MGWPIAGFLARARADDRSGLPDRSARALGCRWFRPAGSRGRGAPTSTRSVGLGDLPRVGRARRSLAGRHLPRRTPRRSVRVARRGSDPDVRTAQAPLGDRRRCWRARPHARPRTPARGNRPPRRPVGVARERCARSRSCGVRRRRLGLAGRDASSTWPRRSSRVSRAGARAPSGTIAATKRRAAAGHRSGPRRHREYRLDRVEILGSDQELLLHARTRRVLPHLCHEKLDADPSRSAGGGRDLRLEDVTPERQDDEVVRAMLVRCRRAEPLEHASHGPSDEAHVLGNRTGGRGIPSAAHGAAAAVCSE